MPISSVLGLGRAVLDPTLRGGLAVGGGVGAGESYEAKRYGVQGGMAGWRAKQLCPQLTFVSGHFSNYQRIADQVMAVLGDFTPLVQRISIDEAFLDVTGSVHLFGPPEVIATEIRRRVRVEIGLPILGCRHTKHLAKVASQVAKPAAWWSSTGPRASLPRPVAGRLIWASARLHSEAGLSGIRTIG